jgi:glycosyltransferase involved in cell wall biosynthesis
MSAVEVSAPEVSVVVPVYKCKPCLQALCERTGKALDSVTSSWEIVLVDDRGEDGSWETIQELVRRERRVKGLRLSRNFGQHAAITAGLAHAGGSWVVVMDCDLQDPPEEIPRLYAKAKEGYDIVFGRRKRKRASLPRRMLASLYFRGLKAFTGASLDGQYGTFSVISRRVVEGYLRFKDRDRHYLFILNWLGYDTAVVDYEPAERFAGRSSYTFGSLIRHGLDGVFFQTTVLLRWIVYLGFLLATVGAALTVYFVVAKISDSAYPGWTSIAVFTLTIGGFIILSTGITGLYIGKMFDQVKERPLFVVDTWLADGASTEEAEREPAGRQAELTR